MFQKIISSFIFIISDSEDQPEENENEIKRRDPKWSFFNVLQILKISKYERKKQDTEISRCYIICGGEERINGGVKTHKPKKKKATHTKISINFVCSHRMHLLSYYLTSHQII